MPLAPISRPVSDFPVFHSVIDAMAPWFTGTRNPPGRNSNCWAKRGNIGHHFRYLLIDGFARYYGNFESLLEIVVLIRGQTPASKNLANCEGR